MGHGLAASKSGLGCRGRLFGGGLIWPARGPAADQGVRPTTVFNYFWGSLRSGLFFLLSRAWARDVFILLHHGWTRINGDVFFLPGLARRGLGVVGLGWLVGLMGLKG